MAISDVQTKGSFHYIYDENKKKITMSASHGDIVGVGSDFLVLEKGSFVYTFDEAGKKIGTMSKSSMEFKNAIGNSFNYKKGSFIYTFDRKCKKTGTKSA